MDPIYNTCPYHSALPLPVAAKCKQSLFKCYFKVTYFRFRDLTLYNVELVQYLLARGILGI